MNNVADKLYNILGTKFDNTDIKTLDSKGKETTDMEEIEMFSFDFLVDSRNYGPMVILLSANENLEVYYGDNTSKSLDRNAKKKWENLIEHLSTFARSNRLGFSLKHTSDLKYDLSNITDITESYRNIFEGYYGTSKTSYSPQGKAKIIIKHSKTIGEDDKRFRNISQIFIENADGERFKLPFKKLTGARAMARHVTEGGNPYDLFGVHISEMVKDINTLGGFVRRSKMYEGNDEAMNMVETGRTHCKSMRKGLKTIAGKRGYHTYKESWEPSAITEQEQDTTAIRKLFTQQTVNQRTEDALPLLARLQKMVAETQDTGNISGTGQIVAKAIKQQYPELSVTLSDRTIRVTPPDTKGGMYYAEFTINNDMSEVHGFGQWPGLEYQYRPATNYVKNSNEVVSIILRHLDNLEGDNKYLRGPRDEVAETSPQMKDMEQNSQEDALRAELQQAYTDGHPEDVERLKAEVAALDEGSDIQWPEEVKGRHPSEDDWGDDEDDDYEWEKHPDEPDDIDEDFSPELREGDLGFDSELNETTKADLQIKIGGLRHQYQQEMIAQNNKGSVQRSYAGADRIKQQIRTLERQLLQTNETSDQMKSMEKNSQEDALRAELQQAYQDGPPEAVDRLKAEIAGLDEAQELTELDVPTYKGYKITISKVPGKKVAARATSIGGGLVAAQAGKTEEQAIEAVKLDIDAYVAKQAKVTGKATLDFNVEFTQELLKGDETEFWAKLDPGPVLVIADGEMLDQGEEILRGYGFGKSARRNNTDSEYATPTYGIPLSKKGAKVAQAVANGRYVITDVSMDGDGNRVYGMDYDSTVQHPGDKLKMGKPAVTIGTERKGMGESSAEPGQSFRPTELEIYNKIKDWSLVALQGYARRIKMPRELVDQRNADEDTMIDEIMGYLFDDDWERKLLAVGAFNEMKEINEFEHWAENIVEGTWAVPETSKQVEALKEFLATEQPVGIDAINVTDALADILADDDLFDSLGELAGDDPSADGRYLVIDWIKTAINDDFGFTNPAVKGYLKAVLQGSEMATEDCNDLDYDGPASQLNANANKPMDDYIQKEDVTADEYATSDVWNEDKEELEESLTDLLQRTKFLLKK